LARRDALIGAADVSLCRIKSGNDEDYSDKESSARRALAEKRAGQNLLIHQHESGSVSV